MRKERVPKGRYLGLIAVFAATVSAGGCDVISTLIDPIPRVEDPVSGESWRMLEEDAKAVGPTSGVFQGWVEGTGYLSDEEIEAGVRLGRWANDGGFGVVRFISSEK